MNSTKTDLELLRAIRMKDYQMTSSLIKKGADINFRDEFGNDALFYSIVYPDTNLFKLVLSQKPSLNSVYEHRKSILHVAVESDLEEKGCYSFIERLIDSGAEINSQDEYGNTPLWYACVYYVVNSKVIRLLLEKGANMNLINKYGESTYSATKENDRKTLLDILEKYRTVSK